MTRMEQALKDFKRKLQQDDVLLAEALRELETKILKHRQRWRAYEHMREFVEDGE